MALSKVGTRDRDDHLKLERCHWRKDHFSTKSHHVTSVANNGANSLIFYNECCMICHHASHKRIWKKRYGSYLNKNFWNSLPSIPVRNYALVLRNNLMDIILFLFWTMLCSVTGPCDIKSFKISTAYDIWFLRYRRSNLMITADFALVVVFIKCLWAVYII